MSVNFPRFPRERSDGGTTGASSEEAGPAQQPPVVQLDEEQLGQLSAVFSAPRWLRDLGIASWLLVGVTALLVGLIWLLGATAEITQPVLAAFVAAAVASPVVHWLQQHGVPRAGGAALVLLAFVALGVLILVLVVGGIVAQSDSLGSYADAAADKAEGWLKDAGVDSSGAESASNEVKSSVPSTISTLLTGIATGVAGIASLVFGLSFAVLSLFFLLKDGPSMRGWVDSHLGVPETVARTISAGVLLALRRYFAGVAIVAAFNAVVVAIGAIILDVPLAGTIAVVTFVTAFIPYIGAFVAGAFAVVIALGAQDATTAAIMLAIVLLANGMLQQVVQPIAFGATLGLNPLVVLIVTIGAGCLFGMVGLVLAAPLTSAAVHITRDLAAARAAARPREEPSATDPPTAGIAPA